jgi:acyl carrier protein
MKEDFYFKVAEIFDTDIVKDDDAFDGFELWDSLAVFSIISFIEEDYHINLTAKEVRDAATVGGIIKLIKSKEKEKI